MSAAASAAGCCCAAEVEVDAEGSAVKNEGSNSRMFSSVRGTFSASRFYVRQSRVGMLKQHCSAHIPALPWDRLPRASHLQVGVVVWPGLSPSSLCRILVHVFVYFLLLWSRIYASWASRRR